MAVSACCQDTASDAPDANFCGECRKPLLRCMAFAECGGLVDDDGLCDRCVRPSLLLNAGAALEVKAGGALVLPLIFANAARKRPLFITQVWIREGQGKPHPIDVPWERLDGEASNPLWVQTSAIATAGRHRVELIFAAATRYRWREEQFVFVSNLELTVEQGGGLVINQTINASGSGAGSDTVYAPIRLETGGETARTGTTVEPAALALVRGERLEREFKIRGYSSGALDRSVVSRAAKLTWRGFAPDQAPRPGPIGSADGALALGRSKARDVGGEGDVQLLVRSADGALDEQMSLAISRRHIDLFIQGGRLCLRAAADSGLTINDRRVSRDSIETLDSGDVIRVLSKHPEALALEVRMRAHHGVVEDVTITRIPMLAEANNG